MITPDLNNIKIIEATEGISDSVNVINNNYSTLYLWVSSLQHEYDNSWQSVVNYYNEYASQIQDSLTLVKSYSANWNNFQTIVESNSSKWLQPFTIFYPTLIKDNVTQTDIDTIITWLNEYFPIKNSDGTLNYVENQIFIVNCYVYIYDNNHSINIVDQPYSYAVCSTVSGTIYAHCQVLLSGGTVNCNQGSYSCNISYDCYPSKNVDCWYDTPYILNIPTYGAPILNGDVFSKTNQNVRGQIQANLKMNFSERRETEIKNLKFTVSNCDWNYEGVL
jgi:hypothetical protein